MIKLKDIIEEATVSMGQVHSNPYATSFKSDKEIEASINEAPEHQLAGELNKVTDLVLKITNKYKKKADVEGMTQSWMMGLHAKLKKAGIKV
tara:strand:- start:714 stop:989 length:276 start_codon:yes stop_codon:yes gene_type:complete